MAWLNTAKDGSGSWVLQIADADGNQYVRIAKIDGASIVQLTADGQIKASAGVLHRLIISAAGVTAGDTVAIKDGGAGGTVRLTVVLDAANFSRAFEVGADFATDIYCDVTLTGGSVYVAGVYT